MTNHGYKYAFFRICINIFWTASATKSFYFVAWHGFFHDFDQWFACQQDHFDFLGARSASELSQRHLRLHDVFRIMLAESFVNRGSGKNFVYQERHFECIERYMSFETFSKQIFRNMFLNKQQLIFEQTTIHFWTHRADNNWNTKWLRPHVLTLSCLGCQTVACLTMINHCSWEFSELSWHHAFPATRPGRSDTFEILWFETYGTIRFWQRLFFEQPICETQLFDTWVHAACMVWSALIFLSWWKETSWI